MNERVISRPVIILIFLGIYFDVQAQEHKTKVKTELSFVWAFAQGSFEDNVDRPLPGILLSFGGRTPKLPLVLSTEFGWLNYGFDDHLELRFPNGSDTPSTSVVNVDAKNSILMAHFVAQIIPFEGKITPHIDGLVGLKYISSNVDTESEVLVNGGDDDVIIINDNRFRTSSTFDAFAISYGVGAGVDVQIFSGKLGMREVPTILFLQLGVRYLFGSEADYLTENSIQASANGVSFEQVESDTDILIPKVGFQLEF